MSDREPGDGVLHDDRLEADKPTVVRLFCVGHPMAFVLGGQQPKGCGWEGALERTDRMLPSCPSCGGWTEQAEQSPALRRVK